jgi:hypothetical protein
MITRGADSDTHDWDDIMVAYCDGSDGNETIIAVTFLRCHSRTSGSQTGDLAERLFGSVSTIVRWGCPSTSPENMTTL